eukprot:CAMPEP_0113453632 /NCGR_PEP_ID=MMETSP0014_2-20120614/7454_1 /TAXON_ID=2857 /ORGANISM="Nitzschia sp." /LENGTH=154 /DNA_ID=CAMNT_0000345025 /DNA_START=293 /DNA_END=757 /DNA_ORIENTATION=- /assembly_acc=CAM_ASM_000159
MKLQILLLAVLAVATQGFAPTPAGRTSTELKKSLFDTIFEMDLFAPKAEQNFYGQREKKGIKTGKIGSNSYVPAGLTAAEYQKIRDRDDKKKNDNYQKNVKKAGVFQDYTDFYLKRGTDTSQAWKKSATLGHTMAKTKYDFDTNKFGKKYDGGQ